jgi:BirA family biotin operon repressor/biotin-[acetyl-CoA-carboxylase] ligase
LLGLPAFLFIGQFKAVFFNLKLHEVGNSTNLIRVGCLANDKKIGNSFRNFSQIQACNFFSFFILNSPNDGFENLAVAGKPGDAISTGGRNGVTTQRRFFFNMEQPCFCDCFLIRDCVQKYYFFAICYIMPNGFDFHILSQTDSTNNYAMDRVRKGTARSGEAWFTHFQTAGRGRHNKKWDSNPGENLLMSVVWKPNKVFSPFPAILNMLVAQVCRSVLMNYVSQTFFIKWPNDLILHDRKAGGILIENRYVGHEWSDAVIGIGINVNQVVFEDNAKTATSLFQNDQQQRDPILIARDLHETLVNTLQGKTENDLTGIVAAYQEVLYRRQEVVFLKHEREIIQTTILGVDRTGLLQTDYRGGTSFSAGDVEWVWEKNQLEP